MITLRGTANEQSVDTSFNVTVNSVDDAPRVAEVLEEVIADEDSLDVTIDITDLFTDVDNEDSGILKSIFENSGSEIVSASITGNQLTLSFLKDAYGEAEVTIRGTSNEKTVDTLLLVTVNPVDDAPYVAAEVSDRTVDEDAPSFSIPLTGVFADVDSDDAQISVSIKTNSNPTLLSAVLQGSSLNVDLHQDQNGLAMITLEATSNGLKVETAFDILVNPVNDAPTVANSKVITLNEDENKIWTEEDLLSFIGANDIDSSDLSVSFTNGQNSSALVLNGEVRLVPVLNFYGSAQINYQVSDGELSSNVGTLSITYNPVNDAPNIASAQAEFNVDEDNTLTASGISFSDVDAHDEDLTTTVSVLKGVLSVTGNEDVTVTGNNSNSVTVTGNLAELNAVYASLTYLSELNYFGQDTLSLSVDDLGNTGMNGVDDALTANKQITINIAPVDDAPFVANPISDVEVDEDAADTLIDLSALFSDVDNEDSEIIKEVVSVDDDSLLVASVENNQLKLTYLPDAFGESKVNLKGTSNGLTVDFSFNVKVNPVDDAPRIANNLSDIEVNEDTAASVVDLSSTFTDVDNDDALIVKSVSTNTNSSLISAEVLGNQLTISYLENAFGEANPTIEALSNGKTVTDSIHIKVNPINDAPVAVADTGLSVEVGGELSISILDNDYDVDSEIVPESLSVLELSGGSLAIDRENGSVTFRHDEDSVKEPYFVYSVEDEEGLTSNEMKVTLELEGDCEVFPAWKNCNHNYNWEERRKWKKPIGPYRFWKLDSKIKSEGRYSYASPKLKKNQKSGIEYTGELSAGVISFDIKVSSSPEDKLQFFVDGELKGQWSGEVDWTSVDFTVPQGLHKLTWIYSKDKKLDAGKDKAWLDNVRLPVYIEQFPYAGVLEQSWVQEGYRDWKIAKYQSSEGKISLHSQLKRRNKTSILSREIIIKESGEVSFDKKLDLKSGDSLKFYINDQLQEKWTEDCDWARVEFDIEAGQQKLTWELSKGSKHGRSKVWIDNFSLPAHKELIHTLTSAYIGNGTVSPSELLVLNRTKADYSVSPENKSKLSKVFINGERNRSYSYSKGIYTIYDIDSDKDILFVFEDKKSLKDLVKDFFDYGKNLVNKYGYIFDLSGSTNEWFDFSGTLEDDISSLSLAALIEDGQLILFVNCDSDINQIIITFNDDSIDGGEVLDNTLYLDWSINADEISFLDFNLLEILSEYEDVSYVELENFFISGDLTFQIIGLD